MSRGETAGEPPVEDGEREGCWGNCVTAGDLGLGDFMDPSMVAYPEPECPEHGTARLDQYEPPE